MADTLDEFQKFRAELNDEILNCGHVGVKRFFALDHQTYESGALGAKTKELLGLVASTVLRCDDCITYHLVRAGELGWTRAEVIDALNVGTRGRRFDYHSARSPRFFTNGRGARPAT